MDVTDKHRQKAARVLVAHPGDTGPPSLVGYLGAVERIQYHEEGDGYWLAPHDDAQVIVGLRAVLVGPDASEMTPEEVRQWADELRVLADLAEEQG